jgi:hypothetical protein
MIIVENNPICGLLAVSYMKRFTRNLLSTMRVKEWSGKKSSMKISQPKFNNNKAK